MPNLKERFERFMSILPGVEHVDALMEQCNLPGRQRADYLAFNRSVIIEQKSLDVDPDYKVPEFFEKHTNVNSIGDADLIPFSYPSAVARRHKARHRPLSKPNKGSRRHFV